MKPTGWEEPAEALQRFAHWAFWFSLVMALIVLCTGCAHCRLACEQRSLFTSTTILLEISHEEAVLRAWD